MKINLSLGYPTKNSTLQIAKKNTNKVNFGWNSTDDDQYGHGNWRHREYTMEALERAKYQGPDAIARVLRDCKEQYGKADTYEAAAKFYEKHAHDDDY